MCPNTELFLVRFQSECGKIRTRNNPVFGHFLRSKLEPFVKTVNNFYPLTTKKYRICFPCFHLSQIPYIFSSLRFQNDMTKSIITEENIYKNNLQKLMSFKAF